MSYLKSLTPLLSVVTKRDIHVKLERCLSSRSPNKMLVLCVLYLLAVSLYLKFLCSTLFDLNPLRLGRNTDISLIKYGKRRPPKSKYPAITTVLCLLYMRTVSQNILREDRYGCWWWVVRVRSKIDAIQQHWSGLPSWDDMDLPNGNTNTHRKEKIRKSKRDTCERSTSTPKEQFCGVCLDLLVPFPCDRHTGDMLSICTSICHNILIRVQYMTCNPNYPDKYQPFSSKELNCRKF